MTLPLRRETLTLANARAFAARAPDFLLETAREYGPNFRVGLGPTTLTFLAEPATVQHVLQKHASAWGRGSVLNSLRPMLGNGLPLSDPPLWLMQRRSMQPSFHRGNGPKWVEVMREMAARRLDELTPGAAVNTHHLMMTIARDIIVRAMFSHSLATDIDRLDAALGTVEDFVGAFVLSPVELPLWLPTPLNRRFKSASAYLTSRLQAVIDERRAAADPPADLLTMLLHAKDPEGGAGMSDQQLRDEVMNIFYAGHETTANLLTWTVMLLGQHADARERAALEVAQVLQGRPPATEDVPKLTFLSTVIREALRLYPPGWMFARQALEDDEVAGTRLQAGQLVLMSPWLTHRLPQYWAEPDRFDPSRFDAEKSTDAAVWKYRYWPFGAGPHVCIGNHFAMLEAVTVLAMLLQRGHLERMDGAAVRPKVGATLSIAGGLPTRFVPRSSAPLAIAAPQYAAL
jgi:cytochrome P450